MLTGLRVVVASFTSAWLLTEDWPSGTICSGGNAMNPREPNLIVRIQSSSCDDFLGLFPPVFAHFTNVPRGAEVLHNILTPGVARSTNRPPNGAKIVGPPGISDSPGGRTIVSRIVTAIRAGTVPWVVAPHELLTTCHSERWEPLRCQWRPSWKTGSAHQDPLTSILVGVGRREFHWPCRSNSAWSAVHSPTLVPSSNRNGNDAFHLKERPIRGDGIP